MRLSKWLINPHPGIFQFCLNLFTLQNKFSLGEMGQIGKPCVTDKYSVIPTESVGKVLLYGWNLCCDTGDNLKAHSDCSFSAKTDSWRGGPVSGNLWPQQDLKARPLLFLKKTKIQWYLSLLSMASSASLSPYPASQEKSLYTVGNQHKAENTKKTGLGHHMKRSPALLWKRWGRHSNTLQWVEVFLVVETAPHKD